MPEPVRWAPSAHVLGILSRRAGGGGRVAAKHVPLARRDGHWVRRSCANPQRIACEESGKNRRRRSHNAVADALLIVFAKLRPAVRAATAATMSQRRTKRSARAAVPVEYGGRGRSSRCPWYPPTRRSQTTPPAPRPSMPAMPRFRGRRPRSGAQNRLRSRIRRRTTGGPNMRSSSACGRTRRPPSTAWARRHSWTPTHPPRSPAFSSSWQPCSPPR